MKPKAAALLSTAALLAALFLPAGAAAATESGWRIDSFNSDIFINERLDGSMRVEEQINTVFDVQKHGIYRYIPVRYPGGGFFKPGVDLNLKVLSVTDAATKAPIQYQVLRSGDFANIKIGDPDKLVSGNVNYKIAYGVENAIRFFGDHEELYWNVNGTGWPVPTGTVSARVHIPPAAADKIKDLKCYTGPRGSTKSDCTFSYDQSSALVRVAAGSKPGNRPFSSSTS